MLPNITFWGRVKWGKTGIFAHAALEYKGEFAGLGCAIFEGRYRYLP
jgi:hypothetical protein